MFLAHMTFGSQLIFLSHACPKMGSQNGWTWWIFTNITIGPSVPNSLAIDIGDQVLVVGLYGPHDYCVLSMLFIHFSRLIIARLDPINEPYLNLRWTTTQENNSD